MMVISVRSFMMALVCGLVLVKPGMTLAQSEEERRKGFYEHRSEARSFDRDREAGLKDYLREEAEWDEQRKKDAQADKSRRKEESPKEDGPEYKADRRQRLEDYEKLEEARRAYVAEKKKGEAKSASQQAKRDAWAMEELGLDQERPRFDISKRHMYGGRPSGGGSSGGGNIFGGGNSNNFPPPPAFDDFNNDAYIPPPAEPFEVPPEGFAPPPPMPIPDSGDFNNDGYFPPPPPPIPADMGM